MDVNELSRIDKIFLDGAGLSPEASRAKRTDCRITVVCGSEVRTSTTLRAAALTFVELATRCFPGAVAIDPANDALATLVGSAPRLGALGLALHSRDAARYIVAFGTTDASQDTLQVTFDGWTAQVASGAGARLHETDLCPLAGILAAALAMSEIFLNFAGMEPAATRRRELLSLWEPWTQTPARGPMLRYLPSQAWLVGLGHLGQAYAWAFAHLPFPTEFPPDLWLVDDERVVQANVETGVLNTADDVGEFKTRVVSRWLERRNITTRILERRIDSSFKVVGTEPRLLLGGLDDNAARRCLANAGATLIDCGIGNRADNFDTFALRTWPNDRSPDDLWPPPRPEDNAAELLAKDNPGYQQLSGDACGRFQLAERSIGVPYVGATAACFALANALRDLHQGDHVMELKLRLATPQDVELVRRPFSVQRVAQLKPIDCRGRRQDR